MPALDPNSPASRTAVTLEVSAGAVAKALAFAVAGLIGVHTLLSVMRYASGPRSTTLERLFDVLRETSVPTWYSSVTLVACAVLLGMIGACQPSGERGARWHWYGLAGMFAYLSLDEAAMIHERVQAVWRRGVAADTWMYSLAAVAFTSALACVGALIGWRLLRTVPSRTRTLFLVAGVTFVAGAVGFDLLGEFHKNAHGSDTLGFALYNGLEEALEMGGVVVFVFGLLDYLRREVGPVNLRIAP
jgi:hypothetical protein